MRKRKLTQKICRELLDYDETSGTLTWRLRDRCWFKTDRAWKSWNSKHAGRPALASRDTHGHLHGKILGKLRSAHRVIYLLKTGHWPLEVIDHIDHCRSNNAWKNLRDVSAEQNAQNRSRFSSNRSGFVGVYKNGASYVAAIQEEYLGSFQTFDEACAVRLAEQHERGFAPGHGAAPRGDVHVV